LRIAVCVKHALDETELRIDPSGTPLVSSSPSKMSTFDKSAVEEAVRIKTAQGGEVTVFTSGSPDAKRTIKEALAMGADKGVHILADPGAFDTLGTARLLAGAMKMAGGFDLILCAEGSSDTYTGQVPPSLAELLSLPFVGFARKIDLKLQVATIEQSYEDTVTTVQCSMPIVVSVVSEINEPRYPTLIQIMQAGKKPITDVPLGALGPAGLSGGNVGVVSMSGKSMNRKRVMIDGSPEEAAKKLVDALASEGVVPK
jgi:electron transfer flavoprotein beta subunit